MKPRTAFMVILFLITLSSWSCTKRILKTNTNSNVSVDREYECTLKAIDLTEDVSRLSTKNDELIILTYAYDIAYLNPRLVFQDYFKMDSLNQIQKFMLPMDLMRYSKVVFMLIELDSNKSLEETESIVTPKLEYIIDADKNREFKKIRKIIGDDDLIGVQEFSPTDLKRKGILLNFAGMHLFDSYKYELLVKYVTAAYEEH